MRTVRRQPSVIWTLPSLRALGEGVGQEGEEGWGGRLAGFVREMLYGCLNAFVKNVLESDIVGTKFFVKSAPRGVPLQKSLSQTYRPAAHFRTDFGVPGVGWA